MKAVRVQVVEYYDCQLWKLSHPELEPAPIIPTSSRTVKSIGVLWYLEQSGRCLQHCRRSNRGHNNLWGKSLWLDFLPGALRVINNSDGTPRSLNTKPWISPNPSLALNYHDYKWLPLSFPEPALTWSSYFSFHASSPTKNIKDHWPSSLKMDENRGKTWIANSPTADPKRSRSSHWSLRPSSIWFVGWLSSLSLHTSSYSS